jgi:hypothetical protein
MNSKHKIFRDKQWHMIGVFVGMLATAPLVVMLLTTSLLETNYSRRANHYLGWEHYAVMPWVALMLMRNKTQN